MVRRNNKRKDKLSANYKLAKEQFYKLNEEFYDGFADDYYVLKLTNLMLLLSNGEEYKEFLKDKDIKVKGAEYKVENKNIKLENIKKYAQMELAMTYYHCLETFIRIFIVHARLAKCPWIELAKISQSKFKEEIEKLSNEKFGYLNNELDTNGTISFVFTGIKEWKDRIGIDGIKGLKKWVSWSASELLKTYDYNTFKHGLYIFPKETGFTLGDEQGKIQKNGDSLRYIARIENEIRYMWARETIWIEYDSRAAIIYTISQLIKNIMLVGKAFHLQQNYELGWLPNSQWSPEFLKRAKSDSIVNVEKMSFSLDYYK
ncbi:hypothetical protein [Crassaminicella profunda]|uniref:hypothetical protein n=1 Tax=Crassaminicella profunda TaxID=1286698 RepID=UPI001CA7AB29|nr:hypothetical protein [Crassaminicella profunda]QZY56656.1 hypothetical protein K7H06_06975 [Crassaminicella profunda]